MGLKKLLAGAGVILGTAAISSLCTLAIYDSISKMNAKKYSEESDLSVHNGFFRMEVYLNDKGLIGGYGGREEAERLLEGYGFEFSADLTVPELKGVFSQINAERIKQKMEIVKNPMLNNPQEKKKNKFY